MSRATAFREAARKTITTSAGFEVVIRKPAIIDLTASGLGAVVAELLPEKQQNIARILGRGQRGKQAEEPDYDTLHPKFVAFCARVMVDPVLYVGDGEPPENAVTPEDLGDQVLEVFSAAMEFYGAGVKEAAEEAVTFRVDAGGDAGEPGGAVVPDDALPAAETVTG